MLPKPRLVSDQPNIENTILYSAYQASSPAKFSTDADKFVMYGGGSSYTMHCRNASKLRPFSSDHVSLFVLSSHFVIWSNKDNAGVEIPYQLIYLHALDKNSLYLQVQNSQLLSNSPDGVLEISLVESNDNHVRGNELFAQVGGNAETIYQAMSTCSAMHFDSEEEEEEEEEDKDYTMDYGNEPQLPTMEVPSSWLNEEMSKIQEIQFKNDGNADDLDEEGDETLEEGVVAGMSVDVGYAQIAGSKRFEQEDQEVVDDDSISSIKRNRKQ
ncbi:LOT5 [Candida theae]|uniref:Protein LOT5 n=1 Tax=Candida theae TaxID=1198502 RepID=A0AAD5BJ70_9ASCO|nr:LOT5 [Candida theae]KAI5966625.1 LOT5 [Candida theae]